MATSKADLESLKILSMESGVFACVLNYLHIQRNKTYYPKRKHKKC